MNYKTNTKLVLDIHQTAMQTIFAKQYDNNSRYLIVEVVDRGKKIDLNMLECGVFFKGKSSKDRNLLRSCTIQSDGTCVVELTENILYDAGNTECELTLVDASDGDPDPNDKTRVLSTMHFLLHVKNCIFEDEEISPEEYSTLDELLQQVSVALADIEDIGEGFAEAEAQRVANEEIRVSNENTRIANENTRLETLDRMEDDIADLQEIEPILEGYRDDAAQSSSDAEAWARGTRGGVAVPTTDETYKNNSKYYAENAGESASNAYTSETRSLQAVKDAEAWAVGQRDGVDVLPTDETYENNSKYYAGLADSSAANAHTFAEQAQDTLDSVTEAIEEALEQNIPNVIIDFDTGHLLWQGGKFNWEVNETNGHLMWEVA